MSTSQTSRTMPAQSFQGTALRRSFPAPRVLRIALAIDGISCLAMGAGLGLGATELAGPFGLPATLLRAAGVVLLPCAALLGYLASRTLAHSGLVWAVVALNVGWALESVSLLVGSFVQPTILGSAFVLVQAVAVLALAVVEGWANRAIRLKRPLQPGAAF
jgi:hypothetical protein